MCRLSLRTARGETWRGQSRERQTDRVARQTDPRHRRSPLRFGPHPPRDHRSLVADVGVKGTVETRERERDERIPSGCRWAVSPQHAPPLGSAPNSACRVSPVCGTHLEVPLNVIIPCPSFSRFSSLLSFCRAHVRPKLPTAATDDTYKHARTSSTGGVSLSLFLSLGPLVVVVLVVVVVIIFVIIIVVIVVAVAAHPGCSSSSHVAFFHAVCLYPLPFPFSRPCPLSIAPSPLLPPLQFRGEPLRLPRSRARTSTRTERGRVARYYGLVRAIQPRQLPFFLTRGGQLLTGTAFLRAIVRRDSLVSPSLSFSSPSSLCRPLSFSLSRAQFIVLLAEL